MHEIKLTLQELRNLKIFLSRTELKGHEALEFVKLAQKIEQAEVSEDGE